MISEAENTIWETGFDSSGVKYSLPIGQDPAFTDALSVNNVIKQKLESYSRSKWETDQEDAFYVCDLGEVHNQHMKWKKYLPRIEPHYAIKSNPDPMVAKLLATLGAGFDCASKTEIQQVLGMGVEPNRIIYANPCKQSSYLQYASQQNVTLMTFDNEEELHKIKKFYPHAELVIRILADDAKSTSALGLKFGAPLDTVDHLLHVAQQLSLNVIGVSFHVGSGCHDEHAFADAVLRARTVFDQAENMGFRFTMLDVGGGFPGADVKEGATFEKMAAVLGPAVDELFSSDVRVIAEPGRYYVSSAFTICAHVIGRRTVKSNSDEPTYMYYLNDGIYGTFNCIIFDYKQPKAQILLKNGKYLYGLKINEPEYDCSLWGPTCDSIDCLTKSTRMPVLNQGDWLYWENMGAYTSCSASQFNGFKIAKVFYTNASS
ncbi:pyridoxal-dependent decarboxylase [Absidia repens]|uniref:ornithine decarboxylase n=1 Tax=Absidia repens TaxID=90262 RepID=A0A1X2IE36_9FUNG|nr:pyridoxal-dependent decarboxylase [Absidia repens]